MTKNPVVNALSAFGYIVFIVFIMSEGTRIRGFSNNTLMAPLIVISLFTLSAGVMSCLFCYQPIQLFFENKKKLAVNLFLKTVMVFGVITALMLVMLFLGWFRQ